MFPASIPAIRQQNICGKLVPVYEIEGRETVVATDPLSYSEYYTSPESLRIFKSETSHPSFPKGDVENTLEEYMSIETPWLSRDTRLERANNVILSALDVFYGLTPRTQA